MVLRVDEEWLKDYQRRMMGTPEPEPQKRNKYGNEKTQTDDGSFDSKHEARVWKQLRLEALEADSGIVGIGRQVAFFLPGGIKYVADFVLLSADGHYTVIDAKSEATRKDRVYRLKKRLMQECLHLSITEM